MPIDRLFGEKHLPIRSCLEIRNDGEMNTLISVLSWCVVSVWMQNQRRTNSWDLVFINVHHQVKP